MVPMHSSQVAQYGNYVERASPKITNPKGRTTKRPNPKKADKYDIKKAENETVCDATCSGLPGSVIVPGSGIVI